MPLPDGQGDITHQGLSTSNANVPKVVLHLSSVYQICMGKGCAAFSTDASNFFFCCCQKDPKRCWCPLIQGTPTTPSLPSGDCADR